MPALSLRCAANSLPPCGGGSGWGDLRGKVRGDDVEDALDIAKHLVVPKSQDVKSLSLQPSCSRIVFNDATRVLPAIDFDDEPSGKAREIDNVRTDRHLPAESMAIDLLKAKRRPQALFRLSRIAAKFAGTGRRHRASLAWSV